MEPLKDWPKFNLKELKMLTFDFIVPESSQGPIEQLKPLKYCYVHIEGASRYQLLHTP